MQKHKGLILSFAMAIFPAVALWWTVLMCKLVTYWWLELLFTRYLMTEKEAVYTFIAVASLTVMAVPHFFWLPVYLFKELQYFIKEHKHATSLQGGIQQAPS